MNGQIGQWGFDPAATAMGSVTGYRPDKLAERLLFDLLTGRNQHQADKGGRAELCQLLTEADIARFS